MRTITCPYCHYKLPFDDNWKKGDIILCTNCHSTHNLYEIKHVQRTENVSKKSLDKSVDKETQHAIKQKDLNPKNNNKGVKVATIISLLLLIVVIINGITTNNNANNSNPGANSSNTQNVATSIDTANNKSVGMVVDPIKGVKPISQVKYTIIRKPNGGVGVFDFIYTVYVSHKINDAQIKWIFDDIIAKYPASKMDIDIWDSKKAFYEELKIYQEEDRRYNAGESIRGFLQSRSDIIDRDDKHNIATYIDHGEGVTIAYPEDKVKP